MLKCSYFKNPSSLSFFFIQEGYQENELKQKEEKLHITAIARQALGMPILHKWRRIHRQNNRAKQQDQHEDKDIMAMLNHNNHTGDSPQQKEEKKPFVNGSTNLFIQNGDGGAMDFLHQPPRRPQSLPTSNSDKLTEANNNNALLAQTSSMTTANELVRRISVLETQVSSLSASIELNLPKILNTLQHLKLQSNNANCTGRLDKDDNGRK